MAQGEVVTKIPDGAGRDTFHRWLQLGPLGCVNGVVVEFAGMKPTDEYRGALELADDLGIEHRTVTSADPAEVVANCSFDCNQDCLRADLPKIAADLMIESGFVRG